MFKRENISVGDYLHSGGDKPTYVRAYTRFRNGKIENVREHCRVHWGTRK